MSIIAGFFILLFLIISYLCMKYYIKDVSLDNNSDVLLLTCIDFRFLYRINKFMNKLGYKNNYDHFTLAGASLGVNAGVNKMIRSWQKTWWDHLRLAISLHKIKKIIIIDHEDCGAYKKFLGFNNEIEDAQNPNIIPTSEINIHSKYLRNAYALIKKVYPWLSIDLYIIGLKSNFINILP